MKKGLDAKAFMLLIAMIGLMLVGLYGRSHLSNLALNSRIGWIATDHSQQLWVTLPKKTLTLNAEGEITHTTTQEDMGIKSLIVDLVFSENNQAWAVDAAGGIYHCQLDKLPCTAVNIKAVTGALNYAKLTTSPDGSVLLLTDNESGQIYRINAQGDVLSKSPVMFNHPNNAVFTADGLVQADTGNFRLVRWPYVKDSFQPDFKAPHDLILKTADLTPPQMTQPLTVSDAQKLGKVIAAGFNAQPYMVEQMADLSWWVLESGVVLKNGTLQQYSQEGKKLRSVELPVTDPITMAKLNADNLVLADMAAPRLVAVNYQASHFYDQPILSVNEFGNYALKEQLQQVDESRQQYQLWSRVCVGLIALLPILGLLMLRRLGYDLNASI